MKLHKWMEGSEKAGRRALLNGFGGKSKAKAKTSMKKRRQKKARRFWIQRASVNNLTYTKKNHGYEHDQCNVNGSYNLSETIV